MANKIYSYSLQTRDCRPLLFGGAQRRLLIVRFGSLCRFYKPELTEALCSLVMLFMCNNVYICNILNMNIY
jgi:hypothetical protein